MAAWDLSTAALAASKNITADAQIPGDVFFKPDGTAMYVLGTVEHDVVHYTLSTAWDITTATLAAATDLALNGLDGLFFKPDGTAMFMLDSASDTVYEYALSAAWTPSTSLLTGSLSIAAQDGQTKGIFFKPDGSVMYVAGGSNLAIYRYNLSTAWDITTATHAATYPTSESGLGSLFFKPDGLAFFITTPAHDVVRRYVMSTAWDITTATLAGGFLNVAAQTPGPTGAFFRPDGSSVYVTGFDSSTVGHVWRYDMAAAVVFAPTVGYIGPGKFMG